MLTLHLLDFRPPLQALLVLLLPEHLALLLDSHLFELKHLDLVVDMLALHGTELYLALNVAHLRSRLRSSWLLDIVIILYSSSSSIRC